MARARRHARLLLALALAGCTTQSVDRAQEGDSTATAAATNRARDGADAVPAAPAGGADVEYFAAATLTRVADSLGRGPAGGRLLDAHGSFQYAESRRAASGVPEVHDRWTDVTVIQAGRGTLLSGGRLQGSTEAPEGEHRGGVIEGGATREVAAGDLMVVPAGTPHQFRIASGDSLRYVTVKVPTPQR